MIYKTILLLSTFTLLYTPTQAQWGKKKSVVTQVEIPKITFEKKIYKLNREFTHKLDVTSIIKMYDTVRLSFIGDVMQHGNQLKGALIDGADPSKPESYDYSHAFKYTKKFFYNSHIAVANMEFPTAGPPFKGYPVFSTPESIITEAQECGLNLFLLANNHLLDMGGSGFEQTVSTYKRLGAKATGAYLSKEDEYKENPVIIEKNGIKVALINFSYGTNGFAIPEPYRMNLMDSSHVKEVISRAKKEGADFIFALPHWGAEYQLHPSETQKRWAKMLFREGVRGIIGSHPHVPQEAEIYKDKFIFYSLGNYITNQSIPDYTQLELLVEVSLIKDNLTNKVEIIKPTYHFLWCFKRWEFEKDYTVIPVEEIINQPERVPNKEQYYRMVKTYNYILEKNLIKEIN